MTMMMTMIRVNPTSKMKKQLKQKIEMTLVASGLPTDRFVYEGFLPQKGKRRWRRVEALLEEERTVILYESPHRIARLAGEIAKRAPGRPKAEKPLAAYISLRCTPATKREMERAAKAMGMKNTGEYLRWLHERLMVAAKVRRPLRAKVKRTKS